MSLRYHFGSIDEAQETGPWTKLYEALTKEEQVCLNHHLPFILMACGVNHVSEAMIPHIVARLRLLESSNSRTFLEDLRVLHLLVAYGTEAVEKYVAVREQTHEMLRDALPKDFEPDPAIALKRFIGMSANVVTEPSTEFLRSLHYKVRDPFPKIASSEILRENKTFHAQVQAIRNGTEEHPALMGVETA
jgi:hypothetical protein